jgi:hypothetical protein
MVPSNEPMWSDVSSPTWSPEQFLDEFKDNRVITSNFEEYNPNMDLLKSIRSLLAEKQETIKIFVMGALWCGDSKREVPRMIKISQGMEDLMELNILYGIKINRLRAKGDPYWSKRPKEAVDPKFGLSAVPTFYIFNKEGNFLGKIIERPKKSSLEEDLVTILEKKL